ncbi:MAG: Rod shape-determining protein MreD [Deltaproteobacteria bacterium]|nr:Rod shape-determining protein MreD [Deltaproteobacteria bacterium]
MFFTIGIFLVILQTTLQRLLPIGPIVPDLILVLCVYWGLHHPTIGAALGSFLLGYSVDIISSPLLGINAFAMSLVFIAVYLGSRSIWLHHPIVSSIIVLLAALVKGVGLVLVWAVFLSTEGFWQGAARYIVTEALIAAVLAPFMFALFRRGESYLEKLHPAAQ